MATLSDAMERSAEKARVSGLTFWDRGRDAAKALSRGERLLRDRGFKGVAAHVAMPSRQRTAVLALLGGGLAALLLLGVGVARKE